MAELPGGETLAGIALYNPASATTVSRTSSTLFMGGVSFAHTSTRGEVYAQSMLRAQQDLWIIVVSWGFVRCELLELGQPPEQSSLLSSRRTGPVLANEGWGRISF